MILKEGGNIFKDPETKQPVTQRIDRQDVDTTLAWLEKITNLPHRDFKLGTTGRKETSGDLDIAVNQNEVTKEEGETNVWGVTHALGNNREIRRINNYLKKNF